MSHRIIFRIDKVPVQQNRVFDTVTEAINCKTGDVVLTQDAVTGIVYNSAFNPGLMIYDTNYQNEQAYSAFFQHHLKLVMEIIKRYFSGISVIEIGCGKGKFLEILRENGFDAIGIDPAYEGDSPYVIKKYFSPSINLKADAIVLRHILEHIPDPVEFLSSVIAANGKKGLIYIEVPCLDWINEHGAWFDIFYEHVNYFRLSDFERIFGNILESGRIFNGQYLYVVADMSSLAPPTGNFSKSIGFFSFSNNFLLGLERLISVSDLEKNRVIWGAGSKGTLFALHVVRKYGNIFNFAIDINPAKQNKYLPVTGLPVVSPEAGLSCLPVGSRIYVMNSNYYNEIKEISGEKFKYYKVDQNEF